MLTSFILHPLHQFWVKSICTCGSLKNHWELTTGLKMIRCGFSGCKNTHLIHIAKVRISLRSGWHFIPLCEAHKSVRKLYRDHPHIPAIAATSLLQCKKKYSRWNFFRLPS
jgi:hypothetical protein